MTDLNEYRDHRDQYEPDIPATVKCCCCDEHPLKEDAAEYRGAWYCLDCAEANYLSRCAFCGLWDKYYRFVRVNQVALFGYHKKCLADLMAHEEAIRSGMTGAHKPKDPR